MGPSLRRGYFDCRFGQLHVHLAIPPGGGFEEAIPLLCIPDGAGSGRCFSALLAPLGADRSLYAIDLPGHGESDPPPADAGPAQIAAALQDFLEGMRLRRVDLLVSSGSAPLLMALLQLRPAGIGKVALLHGPGTSVFLPSTHPARSFIVDGMPGAGTAVSLREFLGSAKPA